MILLIPNGVDHEVAGNAYARTVMDGGAWTENNGVSSNNAAIRFATPTGSWGRVTYFGVFDGSTFLGYGDLTGGQKGTIGAIPTDGTTGTEYLVFRHRAQIDAVYVDGVLQSTGNYSLSVKFVGGELMQFIDFDSKPGENAVVTVDAKGKQDEYGVLIENPAAQLEDFLVNYDGFSQDDIDRDLFDRSIDDANTEEYKGSVYIRGSNVRRPQGVDRFIRTFVMPLLVTENGLVGCHLLIPSTLWIANADRMLSDEIDIIRRSFKVVPFKNAASHTRYQFGLRWTDQVFESAKTQETIWEADELGETVQLDENLFYARDSGTAEKTSAMRHLLTRESQQMVQFDVPIDRFGLQFGGFYA